MSEFEDQEIPKEERVRELSNILLGPEGCAKLRSFLAEVLAPLKLPDEKMTAATRVRNEAFGPYEKNIAEHTEREVTDEERYAVAALNAVVLFYAGDVEGYGQEMDDLEMVCSCEGRSDLSDLVYELHYLLLK